jgi:hypothetical protein
MSDQRPPPEECANCGAAIPRDATACPECGADERIGWREESPYDGLDLPDEAWGEHETHADGTPPPRKVNGLAWYWWVVGVALVLVLAFAGWALRLLR